ncbi:monocarboxylate transporter 13 isoform 3-T5 [Pholidichthys leucotaenia]
MNGHSVLTMANLKPKSENQHEKHEGPDGGWGWVLVIAMFVSTSLVFGLMRSLGIFFVEFVHYFEESAQAISWISSIGLAAQQFFSPVAAALCNAYNARVVVMTGGFLAGLGFLLASQATCLVHLYLTMGVITGLGWGMVFTPMTATVMAHFTRRRTLALGLAFTSIGLSSFAFNPLFQLLVDMYAWRGALLILGGLSLNIVPCGALIRPQRRSKSQPKVNSEGRPSCAMMLQRVASYLELSVLSIPMIVGVKRTMGALGLLQLIESGAGLLGTPLSGLLRDVTGNYIASFMVAGSFLILGTLTLVTLPHFFSCTDPPPTNPSALRESSSNSKDQDVTSELEQINSLAADTNLRGTE